MNWTPGIYYMVGFVGFEWALMAWIGRGRAERHRQACEEQGFGVAERIWGLEPGPRRGRT